MWVLGIKLRPLQVQPVFLLLSLLSSPLWGDFQLLVLAMGLCKLSHLDLALVDNIYLEINPFLLDFDFGRM